MKPKTIGICLAVCLGFFLSSCSPDTLEKVDDFRSQSSYTIQSLLYQTGNVVLNNGETFVYTKGDSIVFPAGDVRLYDTALNFNNVAYTGQAIEINAFLPSNPNNEKIKLLLFKHEGSNRHQDGIIWLRSTKGEGDDMYLSYREIDGVKTLFISVARDGNTGDPKAQIIVKLN